MADLLVVVCGNVAAGKTTLMKSVADHLVPFEPVEEKPKENPFLDAYYANPSTPGLAYNVQTHFLVQKIEGLLSLKKKAGRFIVDRHIREDREIFARMLHERHGWISDLEWATYNRLYKSVEPELPKADLLIYLKADLATIITRMVRRNRAAELDQSLRYWKDLNDLYDQWAETYAESPILTINAAKFDIVARPEDLQSVLDKIRKAVGQVEKSKAR